MNLPMPVQGTASAPRLADQRQRVRLELAQALQALRRQRGALMSGSTRRQVAHLALGVEQAGLLVRPWGRGVAVSWSWLLVVDWRQLDQPPSMIWLVPVVKADSSLPRYTASAAISAGVPEPPHRLARHERGFHLRQRLAAGLGLGVDALAQRRRLHRAGADGVAADAARDEVRRHRLGQADDRGLAGGIDEAVGHALDAATPPRPR